MYDSADTRVRKGGDGERSISHLPVLPPLWAELPTDEKLYARPTPDLRLPETFTLDADASCPCDGKQRTWYDAQLETEEEDCKVYGLNSVTSHRITVQKCRTCPSVQHRSIGPDLRKLGVFNYNNTSLYTHELLDEYTSEYTLSETPLVAWTKVVSRRYARRNCDFVTYKTFEHAWFAYAQLQSLGGRNIMQCTTCGPSPKVVIWDGVTIAFSQSQLTEDLHPPTTIHEDAPVRQSKYAIKPQLIQDKKLRTAVRKATSGPSTAKILDDWTDDEEGDPTSLTEDALRQGTKKQKDLDAKVAHLRCVAWASNGLGSVNKGLQKLFDREIGAEVYEENKDIKWLYQDFFNQVSQVPRHQNDAEI